MLFLHTPIHSKRVHEMYLEVLTLLMERAENSSDKDESAALGDYIAVIGKLAQEYESRLLVFKSNGRDVLEFLMDQHNLTQHDLAKEMGGQPVVSAALAGKRKLNTDQIANLAKRFNVSPAVFYP